MSAALGSVEGDSGIRKRKIKAKVYAPNEIEVVADR